MADALLRNLAVFDTPNSASLVAKLQGAYPRALFHLATSWSTSSNPSNGDSFPVWAWEEGKAEFAQQATDLLRMFFLPLISDDIPFVVAFPFPIEELSARSLNVQQRDQLDLEDIGTLLQENAAIVEFGNLDTLSDRIPQTPIEDLLLKALRDIGLPIRPQIRIGRFRPDFLVEVEGKRWIIEADGRGFHDPDADAARDKILRDDGIADVIRFTGSEIFRDAKKCAEQVKTAIDSASTRGAARDLDSDLDPSQMAAVLASSRATRVLAPAGSGKTKVLLNRVRQLLARGVDPSSILILAFNRKAAQQLTGGLQGSHVPVATRLTGDRSSGVVCRTFNSFGYAYQRDFAGLEFQTEPDGSFWSTQMEGALASIGTNLRSMKIARGSNPIDEFLRANAKVRAGLVSPEDLTVELESYGGGNNPIVEYEPVEQAFSKRQLDSMRQSFDDQIYLSVVDMLRNPQNRRLAQRRFDYVLVDEYQDLNGAQLALVDIISRPHRNIFVVGDDDQLIYGWRFAETENILGFHERMPPEPLSETFTLSTNYRSSKKVVESSARLISRNQLREPKDIRPIDHAPDGSVRFSRHERFAQRAQDICDFLLKQKSSPDCQWRNLSILCRYKVQQPLVAVALDKAGIPRTPLLSYRLFTHPAARLFRTYLAIVVTPEKCSGADLAYVVNRPNRYVRNVEVESLERMAAPWEDLRRLGRDNRSVAQLLSVAESLRRRIVAGTVPVNVLIRSLINEFGLEEFWKDEQKPKSDESKDDANPMDILGVIELMVEEAETVDELTGEWDQMYAKESDRIDMSDSDDLSREIRDDVDEVIISTIHAAKGREYRSTVIFDYDPRLDSLSTKDLEEERRVLYVGVTRAELDILVSVDGSDRTNPYVAELIRPTSPAEPAQLTSRLGELELEEETAIIEKAKAADRIREVDSGQEAERHEETSVVVPAQIKAGRLRLQEIERLLNVGGWQLVAAILLGTNSKLMVEKSGIEEEIQELESKLGEAQNRLALIRDSPSIAIRPFEQQIESKESRLKEIVIEKNTTQSRLIELTVLSGQ